jgi:hypothetical protein
MWGVVRPFDNAYVPDLRIVDIPAEDLEAARPDLETIHVSAVRQTAKRCERDQKTGKVPAEGFEPPTVRLRGSPRTSAGILSISEISDSGYRLGIAHCAG